MYVHAQMDTVDTIKPTFKAYSLDIPTDTLLNTVTLATMTVTGRSTASTQAT